MQNKIYFIEGSIVLVAIYNSNNLIYSYKVPANMPITLGSIVDIPLGNRVTQGIVIGEGKLDFDQAKLKAILHVHEQLSYISQEMLEFMKWSAGYNLVSLGMILKMVLPNFDLIYDNSVEKIYFLNPKFDLKQIKLTNKRLEIINWFKNNTQISESQTKEPEFIQNNFSKNIFKDLINNNVINYKQEAKYQPSLQDKISFTAVNLNPSQIAAVNGLKTIINKNQFNVSLLDGVPGSGKTEVYFELIWEVLAKGEAVLILLPEIALSKQWLQRFYERFKVNPYVWHSNISDKEKSLTYQHLLENKIKVMVGTRSSLFLPFKNLGLIIIDEEHDSSYKQEEKTIYNARDMAIVRAKIFNFPIILASATPSVETWSNVQNNKYDYFKLEGRYNSAPMPSVTVIDMRNIKLSKDKYLSPSLITELQLNLAKKEQSLLFLNRRGYAPLNLCGNCGSKILCPNCSSSDNGSITSEVSLVEHKAKKKLICHYCGYTESLSKNCKQCNTENSIISYGPGVEKIAEEIAEIFPMANIKIVSSDIINSNKKITLLINSIINREVDILVGTQLIAKGYHFPFLSLVGIIDANIDSNSVDLKSNERAWQILYQVMGRAGRENAKGKIVMQSYNPSSLLIKSLIEFRRDDFLQEELKDRKLHNMPPFSKLAGIIINSSNEAKLIDFVNYLAKLIPLEYVENIKGPIPALLYKVNNKFRFRFLVTVEKNKNIQNIIKSWLGQINIPGYISLKIDVDPIGFY
ncbi:primosomal protein N' [Rickettsiales bacterium LUAb2]